MNLLSSRTKILGVSAPVVLIAAAAVGYWYFTTQAEAAPVPTPVPDPNAGDGGDDHGDGGGDNQGDGGDDYGSGPEDYFGGGYQTYYPDANFGPGTGGLTPILPNDFDWPRGVRSNAPWNRRGGLNGITGPSFAAVQRRAMVRRRVYGR